jgi:transposase
MFINRLAGREGVNWCTEKYQESAARESFIAAKCGSEILAPACFEGTCNTALFNIWIEKFLVPVLRPGQVVVMDNAAFHKSEKTKQLIENAGCTLLFLPPYSPDMNPIEIFWDNFKVKVKSIIHNFQTLQQAIDSAFNM